MFGKKKVLSDAQLQKREQKIKRQEESWAKEKNLLERQDKMTAERKAFKKQRKSTTSTKKFIGWLFFNCTVIEIFTGWATYESLMISQYTGSYVDFSPLVTLIGAVVGEVVAFAVYAAKSAKENSRDGIVFEQAMLQAQAETEPGGEEDPEAMG